MTVGFVQERNDSIANDKKSPNSQQKYVNVFKDSYQNFVLFKRLRSKEM